MDTSYLICVVKTLEIEAFVGKREGMGDLKDMDPSDYQRLRTHVEKLVELWRRWVQGHPSSLCASTALQKSPSSTSTCRADDHH